MAVKTRDELLSAMNTLLGDNTSDDALAFMEDVTDTINDANERAGEDWKAKYEENDNMWRKKYKDRFLSGGSEDDDYKAPSESLPDEPPRFKTFEELFKEE